MDSMASPPPRIPKPSSTPETTQSSQHQQTVESYNIRTSRPIPLTASQEAEVRDIYYRNVRAKCADQIRDFAHCATGRTFTIPIKCRQERKAMEKCMIGFATRAEEDAAREEWFATVGERRRKQEDYERWKTDQKALKRQWWADYEKSKGLQPLDQRDR